MPGPGAGTKNINILLSWPNWAYSETMYNFFTEPLCTPNCASAYANPHDFAPSVVNVTLNG
jgi:hypothetical protein